MERRATVYLSHVLLIDQMTMLVIIRWLYAVRGHLTAQKVIENCLILHTFQRFNAHTNDSQVLLNKAVHNTYYQQTDYCIPHLHMHTET